MLKTLLATTFALALSSAGQVLADELYFGGGLAYTNGTSDNVSAGSGSARLTTPLISAMVGQRFSAAHLFWGWEANADFSFGAGTVGSQTDEGCASGATGSYLCAQNATVRAVGVFGTTLGNGVGLFGTLGIGGLMGEFSNSPSTTDMGAVYGWTAGIGVSHGLFNGTEMRGEVIYDQFDNPQQPGGYQSQYAGTTLRVSVVRKF